MMRGLLLLWLCCSLSAGAQSLQDLEGQPHTVADLLAPQKTQALVLVVWCSHCGSCRQMEKDLEKYAQEAGPEVRVFAVTPHPADTPQRVRASLKEKESGLPVLRDPNQTLVSGLKVDRTTTALVYDKSAQLRYIGPFQEDQVGEVVEAVSSGREVEVVSRPLKGCPIPRY